MMSFFPPMDVSPPGCWVLLAGMVAIYLLLCHSIYRLTLSQWFRRRVEPVATLVPVQVTIAMRYVAVTLASYTYLLHRIHCSSGNLDPVSTRCNIDYVPVSSSDLSPWMPTQPSKNKTSWRFWVSFSCQTSANILSSRASFPILSSRKKELSHCHLVKTPVLTVLVISPGSCHELLSKTCSMRLLNSLLDPSPLVILSWMTPLWIARLSQCPGCILSVQSKRQTNCQNHQDTGVAFGRFWYCHSQS
jgi:hypothetical protein